MMGILLEKGPISMGRRLGLEGPLALPEAFWKNLIKAPSDICPNFKTPTDYKWKDGRGRDHPRYGRFIYAFAKTFQPSLVVEVGTDTGGTAMAWAQALHENASGKLVCVDSDVYSKNTYPRVVRMNLEQLQIVAEQYELRIGDSRNLIPILAKEYEKKVDIYLVDGDHTYEGARADLYNGLPMVKPGGYILCHDIDCGRPMNEATPSHPHPVYEAFMELVRQHGDAWCICKFVRKHIGVVRVR